MDRIGDTWGEPVNPGEPINTDGGEFFPSLTADGTLYFTHNDAGSNINEIFRSHWTDGAFTEPEKLTVQVNCGTNRYNAFVARDESYMIVPAVGMPDAYDGVDYYIVFHDDQDRWSEPVNMGAAINADNVRGWSPYVSPDGKYFFFMATRTRDIDQLDWNYNTLRKIYNSSENGNADIYWMEAGVIEELRLKAKFNGRLGD